MNAAVVAAAQVAAAHRAAMRHQPAATATANAVSTTVPRAAVAEAAAAVNRIAAERVSSAAAPTPPQYRTLAVPLWGGLGAALSQASREPRKDTAAVTREKPSVSLMGMAIAAAAQIHAERALRAADTTPPRRTPAGSSTASVPKPSVSMLRFAGASLPAAAAAAAAAAASTTHPRAAFAEAAAVVNRIAAERAASVSPVRRGAATTAGAAAELARLWGGSLPMPSVGHAYSLAASRPRGAAAAAGPGTATTQPELIPEATPPESARQPKLRALGTTKLADVRSLSMSSSWQSLASTDSEGAPAA